MLDVKGLTAYGDDVKELEHSGLELGLLEEGQVVLEEGREYCEVYVGQTLVDHCVPR